MTLRKFRPVSWLLSATLGAALAGPACSTTPVEDGGETTGGKGSDGDSTGGKGTKGSGGDKTEGSGGKASGGSKNSGGNGALGGDKSDGGEPLGGASSGGDSSGGASSGGKASGGASSGGGSAGVGGAATGGTGSGGDSAGECGNGTRIWSEQCDDGNKVTGDGCSSTCVAEQCDACLEEPDDLGIPAPPHVGHLDCGGLELTDQEKEDCEAVLACVRSNECEADPRVCYCGTEPAVSCFLFDASKPKGPCRDLINEVLGGPSSPIEVGSIYFSSDNPVGLVMSTVQRETALCSSECRPTATEGASGGSSSSGGSAAGGN